MVRLLPLTIVLALACHGPDPAEEVKKSTKSWEATLELLATSWLDGDISDVYAKTTAARAADSLEQKLQKGAPAQVRQAAERVEQNANELAKAIAQHDRARVMAIAAALRRDS